MNSASEAALILVSGAMEKPKYPRQRRRARMMFKKRLMFGRPGPQAAAHQGPLEMLAGQLVVLLQIEGQGQFQAHAHQTPARRIRMDRNAAMASSKQREPFSSSSPDVLDPPAGGQANEKPHVRLVRMVRGQGRRISRASA